MNIKQSLLKDKIYNFLIIFSISLTLTNIFWLSFDNQKALSQINQYNGYQKFNKVEDNQLEIDFGSYIRELQRRIRRNWKSPIKDYSKVVTQFRIAKDGKLLSLRIIKSSGIPEADQAAIYAIRATAPFSPLPPEYRKNDMDLKFTFEYNIDARR